jgi:hypothetical protein
MKKRKYFSFICFFLLSASFLLIVSVAGVYAFGCIELVHIPLAPAVETVSAPAGNTLSVNTTLLSDPEFGVGTSLRRGFGETLTLGFGPDVWIVYFDDDCEQESKLAFCGGFGAKIAYRMKRLSIGISGRVGVSLGDYSSLYSPDIYISPYLLMGFGSREQCIISVNLMSIVSFLLNINDFTQHPYNYIPMTSVSLLIKRIQIAIGVGPPFNRNDKTPFGFGAAVSYKIPL